MTVADYIAEFLVSKGVKHVFGFQGSAMLKMLDAIMATGKIEYVQNFNEQASAFAADAYARVSGGIGVAIATSGPGAANLIAGIANAYFDSVPALFITGQDYTSSIAANNGARQNGFQDMDIVSMVKPITKYAVLIDDPQRVRYELEKAYFIATNGRKGSVLIDVPIDIQFKEVDCGHLEGFHPPGQDKFDLKIGEIAKALNASTRPLILAGGGIRGADAVAEFRSFVKATGIPVVSTLAGLDATPDTVGFAGIFGNSEARLASLNADLMLVLGARFSRQHTGKKREEFSNPRAKIIHVDIDKTEINRTFMKEDISVVADLKEFLTTIGSVDFNLEIKPWKNQIRKWKEQYGDRIRCNSTGIDPVDVVKAVVEHLADNSVVTADVGANQMWTAQALRIKEKQRLLNSAGFGAMGYSLPAAFAVSYLAPAVCFTGDGGLQMNLQELNTIGLRKANVKCFVFNNNSLGLMLSAQKKYYSNHFYGNTEKEFTCPNLEKLADAFNLNYFKVETQSDINDVGKVFEDNLPCLVDVVLDRNCDVLNRYTDLPGGGGGYFKIL